MRDTTLATGKARVQGCDYFGRSGVTYTSKAVLGFNPRLQPEGAAFGHSGSVAFSDSVGTLSLLGFLGSRPVEYILSLFIGELQGKAGVHPNHYEVGTIQRLPWPNLTPEMQVQLENAARSAVTALVSINFIDERTRHFTCPVLDLSVGFDENFNLAREAEQTQLNSVNAYRWSVDSVVATAYGFTKNDLAELDRAFQERIAPASGRWRIYFGQEGTDIDRIEYAKRIASWLFGLAMGRWRESAECSPTPNPLATPQRRSVSDNVGHGLSILVDDLGHESDLSIRVAEGLRNSRWCSSADAAIIWHLLESRGSDRTYFAHNFFSDHLSRYSKSLRKAPVYWQLATPSASYSAWMFYHSLTRDTLFQLMNEYVKPKRNHEQQKLERLKIDAGAEPTRSQREEIEDQEKFIIELAAMVEELERIVPMWNPNLNDGVLINFSPLWRLVPQNKAWQKECKECWDSLVAGEYDWAQLAMHLWSERVVPKCHSDRSLAIAHDLEELLWVEDGKWRPIKSPTGEIYEQRSRRSSQAFTAFQKAMDSLAEKVGDDFSASEAWNHVSGGDWDDSDVAMLLWPRRVVLKCFEDEALAKTHRINDRALSNVKQSGSNDIVVERVIDYHEKFSCSTLLDSLKSEMSRAECSFAEFWECLKQAEYDYSELSLRLWPDRIVNQCAEDIDVAREQSMLRFFWVEGQDGQWRRRRSPEEEIADEIGRRNSPAVKASLESLLSAPAPAGNSKSRRRKATT